LSFTITVDTSELESATEALNEIFSNWSDLIEQFLDQYTIPELQAESGSQRQVRSGTYSGTWEVQVESSDEVSITTEADYWIYLEYGTSRGIAPKPVVGQVIQQVPDEIGEFLSKALEQAISE
jgi:hypothetical protein